MLIGMKFCWREIESEKILILSAVKENSLDVLDDKERELNNLKDKNVSDRVEDHGQDTVSYKWDFTEKRKENGSKMLKARLVAQGFEEKSKNERTDSPTCSRQALRMVFVSASIMSWELHSLDITSAFLQGNDIETSFCSASIRNNGRRASQKDEELTIEEK